MNEELKIKITAITDDAKKKIKEVNGEIDKTGSGSKKAGAAGAKGMSALAKGAAVAVGAVAAVAAAVVAAGVALVKLGKSTLDYNKEQAKLVAAFQSSGASAQQAAKTYNELYRYLGDSSKATEAASHLAKITTNQEELAEWTKITQGIYASFGDSLPIEGLTEAANETIRVGKVTGSMADALNWAGVSEDEFNAKLAQTTSLEEREALTRSTLNNLYSNAAEIYEKNNKAMLDYNESQAKMDAAMGEAGKAVLPLMTALNNLGSAFFTALKPAIEAIMPYLVSFVNMITNALNAVLGFFGLLSGSNATIKTVSTGLGQASSGAGNLSTGLGNAATNAEKVKKSTQGFDELNIVSSGSSSSGSSGGGGSGSSAPGYASGAGGMSYGVELEEGEKKASGFAKMLESLKSVFADLKTAFQPTIDAWSSAWEEIKIGFEESKPYFSNGFTSIGEGILTLVDYYKTAIPELINSFSENIAPVVADILVFSTEETGKLFEWLGEKFNQIINEILLPAFDFIKLTLEGTFTSIKEAWDEHGQPFMDALSETLQNIRNLIDEVFNNVILPIWNALVEALTELWNKHLQPLVTKVLGFLTELGTLILTVYNKVIAPVVNWIVTKILPPIVNVIKTIIKVVGNILGTVIDTIGGVIDTVKGIVTFLVGVFTGDWDKAWQGIKDIFGGIWDTICGVFDTVKETLLGTVDLIVEGFKSAWELIQGVFDPVKEFFEGVWNKVKEAFAFVKDWFKEKFEEAWDNVKQFWETDIKPIFTITYWKEKFNTIKDGAKAAFNGLIGIVEKAINYIIRKINTLSWTVPDWVPLIGGQKWGFSFKEIYIPRLAEGGITTGSTLANIGEAGREAVLPLDRNTQWMDQLAEKLAARNSAPTKVVLMLNERELGWATIDAINGITTTTGGIQLAI